MLYVVKAWSCITGLFFILAGISQASAFKLDDLQKLSTVHKIENNSAFRVGNIAGLSGKDIHVKVNLPPVVSKSPNSKIWVRIIGLPDELTFSKGSKVNNIWFMSLKDLRGLTLQSPEKYSGSFNIKFSLMRGDKSIVTILGQTAVNVKLTNKPKDPVKKIIVQQEKNSIGTVQPDVERRTIARAQKFLEIGDIATARMVYENLATQGSARAAFALGQTYDPEFLRKRLIRGLKPDVGKAKSWYKKAVEISRKGNQFANGKPAYEIFQDELSRVFGVSNNSLTRTQREVFKVQYRLM